MTKQLGYWKGQSGKEWFDRTKIDPESRVEAFKKMIGDLDIGSVLEVGCGLGYNLEAVFKVGGYDVHGVDPNEHAIRLASSKYGNQFFSFGDCFNLPFSENTFDLVFTSGVLMHVTSGDLLRAVENLNRVAKKYVLVIEYYAEKETMIPYHGQTDILFKRDYGSLLPNLVKSGSLTKEDGFDSCDYWLFKKEDKK